MPAGGLTGRDILRAHQMAELLHRADRLECARHHLFSSRPMRLVGQASLEQLGIREHDTQLIVQAVKDLREVA